MNYIHYKKNKKNDIHKKNLKNKQAIFIKMSLIILIYVKNTVVRKRLGFLSIKKNLIRLLIKQYKKMINN